MLFILAHLLLGGGFVATGIRNTRAVPQLAGVLERRRAPMPALAARFGVGLQIAGGALVALAPFVPPLGVLGGLGLIVFLVLATVYFHPVWDYSGAERVPHTNALLVNTALAGAFVLVIANTL